MTTFLYNNIKLQSITLYLINKYNLTLLSTLYKQYTKNQYLMIMILCKSYDSNNVFEGGILYKFIDYYVRNHNSKLFQKLIFE